jgi:triosephosphate isomerase
MLFVANWKMNKSLLDSIAFVQTYKNELNKLCIPEKQIVLCPSYPALLAVAQLLKDSRVKIGAQDCSAYQNGPYTGQVSALSLKQAGCSYCIVGHKEQRAYHAQTDQEIDQKIHQLITQGITPIICIGESLQEKNNDQTFTVLSKQLTAFAPHWGKSPLVIAYEPVWVIGSGKIPEISYLQQIFTWLSAKDVPNCQLLYGGSVDEKNIAQLVQIEGIDGFLIGGASLDFQKLQKIVSLA